MRAGPRLKARDEVAHVDLEARGRGDLLGSPRADEVERALVPRSSGAAGTSTPASTNAQRGTPFTQRAPASPSAPDSRPITSSPRAAHAAAAALPAVPRPMIPTRMPASLRCVPCSSISSCSCPRAGSSATSPGRSPRRATTSGTSSPTRACRDIADGFVPKVDDWEASVDWAEVIVFDDTLGAGAKAQALRARGKHVIGGTPYTDRLEDDRSFGQQELKRAGINILPYWEFDSLRRGRGPRPAEARRRYVLKPSGEAANVKRWLYVGDEEDGSDVIRMLEAYEKSTGRADPALPAPAPGHRGGGRGRRLLRRQAVRGAGELQLRAQEAVPGRDRACDRRDGDSDVLGRAEPASSARRSPGWRPVSRRRGTSGTST